MVLRGIIRLKESLREQKMNYFSQYFTRLEYSSFVSVRCQILSIPSPISRDECCLVFRLSKVVFDASCPNLETLYKMIEFRHQNSQLVFSSLPYFFRVVLQWPTSVLVQLSPLHPSDSNIFRFSFITNMEQGVVSLLFGYFICIHLEN